MHQLKCFFVFLCFTLISLGTDVATKTLNATNTPENRAGEVDQNQQGVSDSCNFTDFLDVLSTRESGAAYSDTSLYQTCTSVTRGNGIAGNCSVNDTSYKCLGFFQFCPGTYETIRDRSSNPGVTKLEYLNDPELQREFFELLIQDNQNYISNSGMCQHVGRVYGGVNITESGILMGLHLLGPAETSACLNPSWSSSSYDCTDGYGTHVSSYIAKFGGYDVPGSVCSGSDSNGCEFVSNYQGPGASVPPSPSPDSPEIVPQTECELFCELGENSLGMSAPTFP